jgi:hypothetical protein
MRIIAIFLLCFALSVSIAEAKGAINQNLLIERVGNCDGKGIDVVDPQVAANALWTQFNKIVREGQRVVSHDTFTCYSWTKAGQKATGYIITIITQPNKF